MKIEIDTTELEYFAIGENTGRKSIGYIGQEMPKAIL